jgi:hypothetical protein
MSGAYGYSLAVKGGLITAGKTGTRVAGHVVPFAGEVLFVIDGYKFSSGFYKGWSSVK